MAHESDEPVGSQTIVDVNELVRMPQAVDMESPPPPGVIDRPGQHREFKIRLADTQGRRASAGLLINKMYSWRGYEASSPADASVPNRVTLVASSQDSTIGTITVAFDSAAGLLADELYPDELDRLRKAQRRLCEFTKLAVDKNVRSKRVLGAIFHIACLYAHRVHGCTDIMIEVNPRHVRFYEMMLGFSRLGPERMNPRVSAPGILLGLEFNYLEEQVRKFGGQSERASEEKSFYPYFFSAREGDGLVHRLRTIR